MEDNNSENAPDTHSSELNETINGIMSYDQAIQRTINKNPQVPPLNRCRWILTKIGGKLGIFQLTFIIFFLAIRSSVVPFMFGLGFLTKPAKNYECFSDETQEWEICSKSYICKNGLSADHYRPVEDDEYIDNWVSPQKFDLLCVEKWQIGLMGSMFFIGVISTLLIVPPLSDKCCGRKPAYIIGVFVYLIAYIGIICSTNLYEFYVFQFLNGATFASKVVVGLSYIAEFIPSERHKGIIFTFLLVEPFSIIFLTFWYQVVDRSWYNIAFIYVVLISISFVYMLIFVPESPKWLMTSKKYEDSRESLSKVAVFNSVNQHRINYQILEVLFVSEYQESQRQDSQKSENSTNSIPESEQMTTSTYYKNLVIFSFLWTNTIFSYNTLKFMTKNFDGNIFVNFYLDGISGIVGYSIAKPIYGYLRLRWTVFISISISVFFMTWLFVFQQQYINSHWIESCGGPPSNKPEGSKEDNEHHLKILVPIVVLFIKIGINVAFLALYTASFTEDIIFPFYKRATSTGICNFIARAIAIAAPILAEQDKPIPVVVLLSLNCFTFIISFFLPSYNDQIEFDKKQSQNLSKTINKFENKRSDEFLGSGVKEKRSGAKSDGKID